MSPAGSAPGGGPMMANQRPPNLDFLQRFANPMQMPYGMAGNGSGGSSPGMSNQSGPMHMSSQMPPNGLPGMAGHGPPGIHTNAKSNPNMMQAEGYPPNARNPSMHQLPPNAQQQMQAGVCPGMPGMSPGPNSMTGKPMPPGTQMIGSQMGPVNNQMSSGPPPGMQGPGLQQQFQPCGPQGNLGYKPFYNPPMNANPDPIYDAQYQQFQQQLYATNTRQPQNQMPMNNMSHGPPGMGQNGPFFGQPPK